MHNSPRTATVRAFSDVRCAVLSREAFQMNSEVKLYVLIQKVPLMSRLPSDCQVTHGVIFGDFVIG